MSHLIKVYAVCRFSLFCLWCLKCKSVNPCSIQIQTLEILENLGFCSNVYDATADTPEVSYSNCLKNTGIQ